MAITKLRLPPKAETAECVKLTAEWLRWNDEEQLWLLKQTFHAAFNNRLLEQARVVWTQALETYYAAP